MDHYQNKVITLLIPLLDLGSQLAPAEDLLATVVILRMSEQFSEPQDDTLCHLNGAFSLLTNFKSKWSPDCTDLEGAAFWTFVRQTIRISFLNEKECGFDLSIVDRSDMLSTSSEEVWTNRMTYLLAQVCDACWRPTLPDNQSRHHLLHALEMDISLWRQCIPNGFKPWYYQHRKTDSFPTIRYLSRWHGKSVLLNCCI